MPKIPYKPDKSRVDDEDYEIVSFEDFCDKSKSDMLTLNDNINYRLCYESDKASNAGEIEGESSSRGYEQSETSLNGPKNVTFKRRVSSCVSSSFAPFGRHSAKGRAPLFGGVIPKTRNEAESGTREHRYQRFSEERNIFQRIWDNIPGVGSGMLLFALVCALCVGAYWAACGAMGGAWGEEHYRRLWERAHPDNVKNPQTPISYEKVKILPEYRYHDHNNLSTKNKNNATEKKKDMNKKTFLERPAALMSEMCSKVTDNMRFDCFPQPGANEADCSKRGCCWYPTKTPGAPYCFYPPQYDSYRFVNMSENKHGMSVHYERARPTGYPAEINAVKIDFKYLSNDVLQIKISDAENKRFEPPYPEIPMVPGPISQLKYRVQLESAHVGFKIIRTTDNVTIMNTQDIGGMILSDKFLQISTLLPTENIYGLGEKQARFLTDMNWRTYTMFNHDTAPFENLNLYGTHPFYLALENDGNSHGVLLLNSNAMDAVVQPTPAITFRTVGGILNFFLFLGPTPKEVITQYTGLIGRPFMPPYWSLGFHLCKFNYGSLKVMQDVWQKNRDAGIPFDVQWNDLDFMNNSNDFTYDKVQYAGLPHFVNKLHESGMHYVPLIDPGISGFETPGEYLPWDRGLELDIFVKNSSNQPFVGKVWNKKSSVWPDFTHPSSTEYWVEMMQSLHQQIPFDGAWIDMNEPSNFVSGSLYGKCAPEDLTYKPKTIGPDGLKTKTLCMDARHYAGPHYDWHNLYALTEAIATNFALTELRGRRPFIISRATFVGTGHYAGHWSGDIDSDWNDMQMTIPDLLSFSLFGIPMMGADICGFRGNTTVELCKRWMQLGAFYPFSRNHNSDTSIPQDPASLGPEVVSASRTALRLRYNMLPYYYTLFWRAHVFGDTVARPLFFEFPSNALAHGIDTQFMIGPYVMITPILKAGVDKTKAYFPGPQKWYNIVNGLYLTSDRWQDVGENETVSVRGGAIIPLQEPPTKGPVTTANSRSEPLQLIVVPDKNNNAQGELYWDDGDSLNSYEEKKYSHIEFSLKYTEIYSTVLWWGYGVPSINNITILGQPYPIKSVSINDVEENNNFTYKTKSQILQIFNLDLPLDKPFNVKWTYKNNIMKQIIRSRIDNVKLVNDTVVVCKNKDCTEYD